MVNRLKLHLGSMISENQWAFVGGRQIHDNIYFSKELFHFLKNNRDVK